VKEGTVGRVVMFESHFDRFRPELKAGAWREKNEPGSGVLFDLGSHLLDQAMTLFGTPEAIEADVRIERDGAEVDDAFDVTLFYPQGRALLRASMLASIPGARFTVRGTQGSYVKHGMDPQEDALKLGQCPTQQGWGMDPEDNWGTLSILEEGNLSARKVRTLPGDYRGFYENVRDAIEKGSKLAVSAQDAFSVMVGMELALESSRSGRRIPWPK
jgi:predicted dehydrogenase